MKSKKEIEAIHKHDLKALLQNLGFLEDYDAGKIKCEFCSDAIRENNFGAIYSQNKKIKFACSKIECLEKMPKK